MRKIVTNPKGSLILTSEIENITYQAPFAKSVKCEHCGKLAELMAILNDDGGLIESQRPEDAKIWPHDSMAAALYMCTYCGKITTVWNQA